MAARNTAVFGIYPDQGTVNEAMDALRASGFHNTDVSVLMPENLGSKDFAHRKHTKAPEGAVAGGSSGALVGAALGYLAAGSFSIPGLEPFAAAGPIMAALSGLGIGSMLGAVTGALAGAGIPEYEAKRFEGRIRRGGILLSVHCENSGWVKTAKDILRKTGATDIASAHEAKADFAKDDKPFPRSRNLNTAD